MTEYRLIRSRRKSLAVQITPQGEVIVRAPNRLPLPVIEDFLRQKQDWITSRAGRARERQQAVQAFCLTENALLPLRGKTYPVTLWDRPSAGFDGERFFLPYGDDAARKSRPDRLLQAARGRIPPRQDPGACRGVGDLPQHRDGWRSENPVGFLFWKREHPVFLAADDGA